MSKLLEAPQASRAAAEQPAPTFRGLKWVTILAPLVFFGVLDFAQHVLYANIVDAFTSYLLAVGIVLVGTLAFSEMIFGVINRMQIRLVQQNRELLALHQAGLDIAGELELEAVLQKIVERARELVRARYGALSLLREEGGVEAFLTSGVTTEEEERLIRLIDAPDVSRTVSSVGASQHVSSPTRTESSPPLRAGFSTPRSHVAVPILSHGRCLGNLHVTTATGRRLGFSADDEETLIRFATQAALAIENARLHRRIQALAVAAEREWIARELHDTLAQVLGYVNTKAQAAQELLRSGRMDRAAVQIGQLAEAARAAYGDVREGILGLRTSVSPDRDFRDTVQEYLEQWQEQSGVLADFDSPPDGRAGSQLSPLAEIQLLRILQEALANVRKHSNATHVLVSFVETAGSVKVAVEDDGIGFDPSALGRAGFPRFGLATMRERAEAIGGTMEIYSAAGHGTRITVWVPAAAVSGATAGGSRACSDR